MRIDFKNIIENKRIQLTTILLLLISIAAFLYQFNGPSMNSQQLVSNQLIAEWQDLYLKADRFTEGYRGPISARTFGYIGLAAYEAGLPAMSETHQSFVISHTDLKIPQYNSNIPFNVLASLNACYKTMFDKFYFTTRNNELQSAEELYSKWNQQLTKSTKSFSFEASNKFGADIASAIFQYSATDSIGHQAFLNIYDRNFIPKSGEGNWKVSEEIPMPPLLPHWGEVRPFVIRAKDYLAEPLPEYSLLPSSLIYTEALEVLTVSSPLSRENKWIAEFWSDDHPGITFTPSARWISITNQVIKKECPPLEKTLETFLKMGIALTDGTIACWYNKYFYNLERPEAYIHKVFDKNWHPLFHTPPFPSYPSGHSVVAASAAEVLNQLYGSKYKMTDYSHKGREEFIGKPRSFHSFYDMAFEDAFSRILLGVHYRKDCEEGLRIGFQIGKRVSAIDLLKPEYSVH